MENFIKDILIQLIEDTVELKNNAINDFEKGSLFGYYTCISKILNQAEAFGVLDKLPKNLRQFNPEDLLSELNRKIGNINYQMEKDTISIKQIERSFRNKIMEKYKYFIQDLVVLLKERLKQSKENKVILRNEFDAGINMGIYECLDLIRQQALAFEIPLEDIGLENHLIL